MALTMDVALLLFLLFVTVAGDIIILLVVRSLIKQVADKVQFTQNNDFTSEEITARGTLPGTSRLNIPPSWQKGSGNVSFSNPIDKPSSNQVMEEETDIEFSEQSLSSLPEGVKFEVEGGDTTVPPGFEEGKKK